MSVSWFIQQVEVGKITFIPCVLGRKLSRADARQLADAFLAATDKLKKAAYLSVFQHVAYPYDAEDLLQWARKRPHFDNLLAERSVDALMLLESHEIRSFALDKLQRTRRPYLFTSLLKKNYQPGDADLLTSFVDKYVNEDIIEALASSYVDIYKENSTQECLNPLVALYRKMNCGIHRYSILEIFIRNGVLPDDIRCEMEFDSYQETQLLYQKT